MDTICYHRHQDRPEGLCSLTTIAVTSSIIGDNFCHLRLHSKRGAREDKTSCWTLYTILIGMTSKQDWWRGINVIVRGLRPKDIARAYNNVKMYADVGPTRIDRNGIENKKVPKCLRET